MHDMAPIELGVDPDREIEPPHGAGGTALFFAATSSSRNWPDLVVALRFDPGPGAGFHPGILLVPERDLLFVGAGTSLLVQTLACLTSMGGCRGLWVLGMEAARRDCAHVGRAGTRRVGYSGTETVVNVC
jgi:hypothetical protein